MKQIVDSLMKSWRQCWANFCNDRRMLAPPLTSEMLIVKTRLVWVSFLLVALFLSGCVTMNSAENPANNLANNPAEQSAENPANHPAGLNLAAYPPQIRFSTERSQMHYERSTAAYALHYAHPDTAPPEALQIMEDGTIAVFSAQHFPSRSAEDTTLVATPVYTLQPGNVMAVPTGRIFVRFYPNTIATDHSTTLEQAGYVIESSPPYAPHTAWVRSSSGNIAEALSNIPSLEAMPDIENVEPQMVIEHSLRAK
jgi:hypothetical protein